MDFCILLPFHGIHFLNPFVKKEIICLNLVIETGEEKESEVKLTNNRYDNLAHFMHPSLLLLTCELISTIWLTFSFIISTSLYFAIFIFVRY